MIRAWSESDKRVYIDPLEWDWSYYRRNRPIPCKAKPFMPLESKQTPLTYILGSVCSDGIVLVADKKVTRGNGISFDFEEKIHGEFHGVLFGAAGSTGIYELLRYRINELVEENRNGSNPITKDNIISKLLSSIINDTHERTHTHNVFFLLPIFFFSLMHNHQYINIDCQY